MLPREETVRDVSKDRLVAFCAVARIVLVLPTMRLRSRKILIASLGIASVTYVACTNHPSGNLRAPPPDASTDAGVHADAHADHAPDAAAADVTHVTEPIRR